MSEIKLAVLKSVKEFGEKVDKEFQKNGHDHYMAHDEHYADIKRTVATADPYTDRTNVVMLLLYEWRQNKRKGFESLDCAIALQELERMGKESISKKEIVSSSKILT